MLPGLDGARLLKMLAQHPFASRLPIVILSGVDPDRLTELKELPNVVAHWHKPVDLPQFARSVKRLLSEDAAPDRGPGG
jgi:CheY-like chemotaxis protein